VVAGHDDDGLERVQKIEQDPFCQPDLRRGPYGPGGLSFYAVSY